MDNLKQATTDSELEDWNLAREKEIAEHLRLTYSRNPHERSRAAARLGELHAGAERLVELLKDGNTFVRTAAAGALGLIDPKDLNTDMIEELLSMIDDPDNHVCAAAINSLGRLGVEAAREQILEFLDDPNSYVLAATITALGRLGPPELGERLAKYLSDPNRFLEKAAVRAIGNLGYQPAGDSILKGLERLLQIQLDRKELPLLYEYIEAVSKLNLREAIPSLVEIAKNEIGARSRAVNALVAMNAVEAAPLMIKMLSDPGERLRISLIRLMVIADYSNAIPIIRPLLKDWNFRVRQAALYAVTQMEDFASIHQIRWMCANDPNPFLRTAAIDSLVSLSGDQAIPELIRLADDTNTKVRETVVQNLVQAGFYSREVFDTFVKLADDPAPSVQEAAREVLQRISLEQITVSSEKPNYHQPVSLPEEVLSEKSHLVDLLAKWQSALAEPYPQEANLAELQETDQALSRLIHILETTGPG